MFNKRGQISETMTWVVATTAIVVILILSIFIVQLGFKSKSFKVQRGTSDLLVTKSFMGYLFTDDIYGQLEQDGNLNNEAHGKLAQGIFLNVHNRGLTWIGVRACSGSVSERRCNYLENKFFGKFNYLPGGGIVGDTRKLTGLEVYITLDENKEVYLY